MKKQKRVPLKYGSARVDEDCPQETIDALNKLSELVYNTPFKLCKCGHENATNYTYCYECGAYL